jgi:hypothetical protein
VAVRQVVVVHVAVAPSRGSKTVRACVMQPEDD